MSVRKRRAYCGFGGGVVLAPKPDGSLDKNDRRQMAGHFLVGVMAVRKILVVGSSGKLLVVTGSSGRRFSVIGGA